MPPSRACPMVYQRRKAAQGWSSGGTGSFESPLSFDWLPEGSGSGDRMSGLLVLCAARGEPFGKPWTGWSSGGTGSFESPLSLDWLPEGSGSRDRISGRLVLCAARGEPFGKLPDSSGSNHGVGASESRSDPPAPEGEDDCRESDRSDSGNPVPVNAAVEQGIDGCADREGCPDRRRAPENREDPAPRAVLARRLRASSRSRLFCHPTHPLIRVVSRIARFLGADTRRPVPWQADGAYVVGEMRRSGEAAVTPPAARRGPWVWCAPVLGLRRLSPCNVGRARHAPVDCRPSSPSPRPP